MGRNWGVSHWSVAQPVERLAVNEDVAGSSPATSANTTSGTDLRGAEHRSRSLRADTQRDLNSVAAAGTPPASRRNSGEPSSRLFIDESDMEFAAYVLVLVAVGFPCLFLGAVYLLLVA
jgi:hypothetical protein